jgi:hypothetical protein
MEYIAGSEPKYRLWKKDRFWEPKDCYVDAELGTKKAAETLLKQYFRKWPDYVDSYDTGEIFDKDELKKIKEEMF